MKEKGITAPAKNAVSAQIPESCIARWVLTLSPQNQGLAESVRGEHVLRLVAVRK